MDEAKLLEIIKMAGWKKSTNYKWQLERIVPGYGRKYVVHRLGEVFSRNSDKWLKVHEHKNGYLYVRLYRNGRSKAEYLHRLVAMAFIPNPYGHQCVIHKDGNKKNNRRENLQWISRSQLPKRKAIEQNTADGV